MLRDALLTLLWTSTGRQQHWNAPTAGLRVLITLGPAADRILSSGWWRPEAPGPWLRLWFPQPLGTLQRTAVASAFLPSTGACSASSSGAQP